MDNRFGDQMLNNIKIVKDFKIIIWAFNVAAKMNKKMLAFWILVGIVISYIPTAVLFFYQKVIWGLTEYINNGLVLNNIKLYMVGLGIFLSFLAISKRINMELIYLMMYDSYYIGMQDHIMKCIQKIPLKELFDNKIKDEFSFTINRAGALTDVMSSFCSLLSSTISIILLIIYALKISIVVSILILIFILFIIIVDLKFRDKVRKGRPREERISKYFEQIPEDFGFAKEIRIRGNTDFFVEKWKKAFNRLIDVEKEKQRNLGFRNFTINTFFYFILLIQLFTSLFDVYKGQVSSDSYIVLYMLMLNVYHIIRVFAKNLISLDYGLFALEHQMDFTSYSSSLVEEKIQQNSEPSNANAIEVENLCFAYSHDHPVLNNINFKIKKGEVIALVGYNGCGKSTLVKILLNLFKPTAGSVNIAYSNNRFTNQKLFKNAENPIGAFLQDSYLFNHTLYENIGYGNIKEIFNIEKVYTAIKLGGIENLVNKLNLGPMTVVGKRWHSDGQEFSGGEKLLIAVSRVYMGDDDIFIFDEPASMLDPIAEVAQYQNIRSCLSGKTIILISHRLGFARYADKILMMENGRIIEQGTHDELMRLGQKYYLLFQQQSKWYNNDPKEDINEK